MKKFRWDEQEETLDTLFGGRLKILQKKQGYRFSIDALLLAHFSRPNPDDRILELGTGCGVIPLILFYRKKALKIIGAEIQPSLADLARRNAALNRCSSRFQIQEEDLRNLEKKFGRESFDRVLANPPYRKVGSGRINPQSEKAIARHEVQATLEDVLRCAHSLLKDKGRLEMIYPASRTADLMKDLSRFHLEPKRVQFVHSHERDEARLVLVEALKEGHAQVKIPPPLFLFDDHGNYTPAARELFQ
jgi:tRNA1Val (adenine37-N6)-methyltransferase